MAKIEKSPITKQTDPEYPEPLSPEPMAKMKRLTIDVPEALHRAIKVACAERGVKMADEIRGLLEKHFRK